jgi:hypothetical protein
MGRFDVVGRDLERNRLDGRWLGRRIVGGHGLGRGHVDAALLVG